MGAQTSAEQLDACVRHKTVVTERVRGIQGLNHCLHVYMMDELRTHVAWEGGSAEPDEYVHDEATVHAHAIGGHMLNQHASVHIGCQT